MSTITTRDGVDIFYKDWGPKNAQPIFFHHGWPLSADDWDTQMLYFLDKGYRVIAHDRRGHGRSTQVSDGHDMDHYAADAAAVVEHLELRNAVHVGHSTGGGEATRYVAQHGQKRDRVAKLVLIGAVPPIMLKTAANPGGLPIEVFDDLRKALANNRAQFYVDFASGPFYGYNRPGAKASQGVIENWWRQGMMGGAKAHHDGIKAFSETDFTRRPQEHQCADARDARRRRSNRADRRFRTSVSEASQERHAQDLREVPARHVHDTRRRDQPGPPCIHQVLNCAFPNSESDIMKRFLCALTSTCNSVLVVRCAHRPDSEHRPGSLGHARKGVRVPDHYSRRRQT